MIAGLGAAGALAQSGPTLQTRLVASGLTEPVFVTAPAGDARLFIVERRGVIRVLEGGALRPEPFLDISDSVSASGERGLLGLAFDPNYASNRRFFVNFIDRASLHTVIATYQAHPSQPHLADSASGQVVLVVEQPAGLDNHKAGWIGFRPGEPGNLYIATGDGGGANDPQNRAQNPFDNLGKILRIDVSGDRLPGDAGVYGYAIPAGNLTGANPEIFATGLRNPYRNSFDRQTGLFYIADVGQGAREEVNLGVAGGNYGWRKYEGTRLNVGGDPEPPGAIAPIHEYGLSPRRATIIGGYVYRGAEIAGLGGTYFYADFMADQVVSFRPAGGGVSDLADRSAELLSGSGFPGNISSFGEDGFGNLYLVSLDGAIGRIETRPATLRIPAIAVQPASLNVAAGSPAVLSVQASGDGALTYQWFRDGVAVAGGNGDSLVFAAAGPADVGAYTVVVSGPGGSVTSAPARLGLGTAARLRALSVRSLAGQGAETLITGIVASGVGPKKLVIRAVGPSLALAQYGGLSGALTDPQLRLFDGSGQAGFNDDWGGDAATAGEFARVGLAPLAAGSRDAGLVQSVTPGGYTTHVNSAGATGIALMEVYDGDDLSSSARLAALSARSAVGVGANILIIGFVIVGEAPLTVLVRGLGPALIPSGVSGTLHDPALALFTGSTPVATNDNWGGSPALAAAFASVGLAAPPADSRDAALLVTLPPGTYTAQLSGVGGTTGVGLVEIYELR